MAQALLLDIGGVVLEAGGRLVTRLAEREPRLQPVLDRVGGIATTNDALWQQMLRQEISERAYWAQRAAELGEALAEAWDTRAMITRMYDLPQDAWLIQPTLDLMVDVKEAGLALGALTNDMADFHGEEWVSRQKWLDLFDVIVDASHTGVLKPDPRAFLAAADALGLPPGDIVYLDDMPWNVAGGRAAGLHAVDASPDTRLAAIDEARAHLGLRPRGSA